MDALLLICVIMKGNQSIYCCMERMEVVRGYKFTLFYLVQLEGLGCHIAVCAFSTERDKGQVALKQLKGRFTFHYYVEKTSAEEVLNVRKANSGDAKIALRLIKL
jgi:hypothetical protein